MKKVSLLCRTFAVLLLIVVTLAACKTSIAYTFTIATGDKIEIKLNTSEDWSLKQKDGAFTILHGEDTILKGLFGTEDNYKDMKEAIESDDKAKVIKESEKDGNQYIFYSYEGSSGMERDVILMVKDAKTCVIMAGNAEEQDVNEAIERLTITKD